MKSQSFIWILGANIERMFANYSVFAAIRMRMFANYSVFASIRMFLRITNNSDANSECSANVRNFERISNLNYSLFACE